MSSGLLVMPPHPFQWIAILAWVVWLQIPSLAAHPGHEGQPDPAPADVVALVFADFHSAPCGEVGALLDELARARHLRIQRLFKHAPAQTEALAAHEAALAAGAQGKFQAMHDLLLKQSKPAGSVLMKLAQTLGLDLARFETALEDRQFRDVVLRDIAEARGLGVRTTPTVFLNGSKVEGLEALRTLVRGSTPPALPSWDSLPVENPRIDLSGSASSGPEDAPVTLVEFSDFRCGFCRLYSPTLAELVVAYPGRIRRVFKHYPLDMEGTGLAPHLAALAALEKGRFWDMHQTLMTRPLDQPQTDVLQRARILGLDPEFFRLVLSQPRLRLQVERDVAEGEALGIRATPTTFLNGRRLVGRRPIEVLKGYIDAILGLQPAGTIAPAPAAASAVGTPVSIELPDGDAFCVKPGPSPAQTTPSKLSPRAVKTPGRE